MQNFFKHTIDQLYLRFKAPEATRQVGALPYRVIDGRLSLLLVTSRRSGRWIFPKGSPIDRLKSWETAAQEAPEEAGIEGDVEREPIGSFRAIKRVGQKRLVVHVDIYPMRVTKQHDKWHEMQQRRRLWVPPNEAARLLAEPVLANLTVMLSRRVAGVDTPPASVHRQ